MVNTGSMEMPVMMPQKVPSPHKQTHLSSYNYDSYEFAKYSPSRVSNCHEQVSPKKKTPMKAKFCESNIEPSRESPD